MRTILLQLNDADMFEMKADNRDDELYTKITQKCLTKIEENFMI